MQKIIESIEYDMPTTRFEMLKSLREFFTIRHNLSTVDGVILDQDCIVISPSLKDEILLSLHAAHQGVTSKICRVEASICWPGIIHAIYYT
jgi:hypothetical protein